MFIKQIDKPAEYTPSIIAIMTRRGGTISQLLWDPYSVRGPQAKSITGSLTTIQHSNVVVVLVTAVAIIGFFLIVLLMSNYGWTAADFQLQSSYEHRMLKVDKLAHIPLVSCYKNSNPNLLIIVETRRIMFDLNPNGVRGLHNSKQVPLPFDLIVSGFFVHTSVDLFQFL